MVLISSVEPSSIAFVNGIKKGDYLISINGNEINDVLDYRFYLTEKKIILKIHREAELLDITVNKNEYDDIGLDFETYLMDKKHTCKNKCIFCFIDQMPKGHRETLYFKDDDSRMSFLMGNYITTTNLSEQDIERIIKMKLSPVNISVHTTNPDLRVKMMKNPNAAKIMDILKKLTDSGINVNAQIVLCKGINDKNELKRTMNDLETLMPHLKSVSVVPAGITKFRENLPTLLPFSQAEAAEVIDCISEFSDKIKEKHGSRLIFPGDEFFITAKRDLPNEEYYEGYPQFENGVGTLTSLIAEFEAELEFLNIYDTEKKRSVSIATGKAAYFFICELCRKLSDKCKNLEINVYMIENEFFGENITVAGLVVGGDIIKQLKGKTLGERLLLPSVMLRHERDLFLDDVSIQMLETELGIPVCLVENDGADLIQNILY